MPTCSDECTTPCNCYIDEDGYWAERPQDGRHNIAVSGSATIEDPLTFSFLQSEFFRPPAAEIRRSMVSTTTGSVKTVDGTTFDITIYQSPNKILIAAPVALAIETSIAFGNFFLCGASATFTANGTGDRVINIVSGDSFDDTPYQIAGNAQPGLAAKDSILSCCGFVPGYLDKTGLIDPGILDNRLTAFIVSVYQTSNANMNVSNIKLWVSKI